MPISDLTGTTWRLNNTITIEPNSYLVNIDYGTDSFSELTMQVLPIQGPTPGEETFLFMLLFGSYIVVQGESSILNTNNEEFTITGGDDAGNSNLISWLDGNATQQSSQLSVDLSTLSGWSDVSAGNHTLKVKAKATGYRDSALSTGVSFEKAAPAIKCTVAGLGSESPSNVTFTKDADFTVAGLGIEEVTVGTDVFIKIPTMYRKVESVSDNQITSFTIANAKIDNDYQPYTIFIDENNHLMDYVLIGKYWNNAASGQANSISTSNTVDFTPEAGRTMCKAVGSGYMAYDWQFHELWKDLIICFKETVNTNTGSTWTYDDLGIYWSNKIVSVDGVIFHNPIIDPTIWYICYKPSKYASLASTNDQIPIDYIPVGYSTVKSSGEIKTLGYDANNPFFNYPTSFVQNASYNTYYCDYYGYSSGNLPMNTAPGYNNVAHGAFYISSGRGWADVQSVRLCYRPIS